MSLELFLKRENYFKPTSIEELSRYGSFIICNSSSLDTLQITFSYEFKKLLTFNPKTNSVIAYPTNSFLGIYAEGKIISATSSLHSNGNKLDLKLDKLFISDFESNFLQKLESMAMKKSLLLKGIPNSKRRFKNTLKII